MSRSHWTSKKRMDLHSIILQILYLIIFGTMLAFGFMPQSEQKCSYRRVSGLMKMRCYDMKLKEVPQELVKSSIDILDLSFNRIKKLRRHSFQKCKGVRFLLLYENMIQSVEPGTFSFLTSLEEIDLSNNALVTIPMELFQLPSLRNLYVDSNDLINLNWDLAELEKPIKAPLEYLNIAECGLKDLPDLGVLPKLWHLNASANPLTELNIMHFGAMCNLKYIDLTKTSLSDCSCNQVLNHLLIADVKTQFVPKCAEILNEDVCPLPYNATIHSVTYSTCKQTIKQEEVRNFWIFTIGCCGGVILVLLLLCCCIQSRRRKKRAKKQKKQLQHPTLSQKTKVVSPKNGINQKSSSNHKSEDELLSSESA